MTHTTSDARKRATKQPTCKCGHTQGLHVCEFTATRCAGLSESGHRCVCDEFRSTSDPPLSTEPPPTTPRVAESLDDLAVGMVVAWESDGGRVSGFAPAFVAGFRAGRGEEA